MSLPEILESVGEWTRQGQPWGEATLIRVRRSAPRPPGARYAVGSDGSFAGTISAGCVEADLREHLLGLLRGSTGWTPGVVSYGITDEMAAGVGLACGGEIEVLIRRHEPEDPVWAEVLDLLHGDDRFHAALVTGLSDGIRARQIVVRPDGSSKGTLGDPALDREVTAKPAILFAREGSEVLSFGPGLEAFVDRILPPRRLVIVGATPVAASLSALASRVGYEVTIVDPREALARESAFPDADLRVEWPEEALGTLGMDAWTDVVVLAHDDRIDRPALRTALIAGCRYVGLLGGRRTQELRREALAAEGVPDPALARIRGPVGLDIGAVTPQEIAVSILAEMLAVRRLGADGA